MDQPFVSGWDSVSECFRHIRHSVPFCYLSATKRTMVRSDGSLGVMDGVWGRSSNFGRPTVRRPFIGSETATSVDWSQTF